MSCEVGVGGKPALAHHLADGDAGQRVSVEDTLAGCEYILQQTEFDDDEMDYYMIGALPAAKAQAAP